MCCGWLSQGYSAGRPGVSAGAAGTPQRRLRAPQLESTAAACRSPCACPLPAAAGRARRAPKPRCLRAGQLGGCWHTWACVRPASNRQACECAPCPTALCEDHAAALGTPVCAVAPHGPRLRCASTAARGAPCSLCARAQHCRATPPRSSECLHHLRWQLPRCPSRQPRHPRRQTRCTLRPLPGQGRRRQQAPRTGGAPRRQQPDAGCTLQRRQMRE
jgi:hypothetical protein